MLIYDGHLDLAMNAMEWNRDLRWSVETIRQSETGMTDKPDRGKNTVSLPAMRKGKVCLCNATLIARYVKRGSTLPGWHSQEQAWAQTQGQLAWYRAMEKAGEMKQVIDTKSLDEHIRMWQEDAVGKKPIGFVLSLEGADSIVSMEYLEIVHGMGLRAIGPAHYGPGVYAFGTDSEGGIGDKGRGLLRKMEELNIILDVTHLCDQSFREAMDAFTGPLWASHSNSREFVPHNRQFTDEQMKEIIDRGGVIGTSFDTWMLVRGWVRGSSDPLGAGAGIDKVIDNISRVCDLAGSSEHAALGTDLDGAFGKEQSPHDLDTIADLQKIPEMLSVRGFRSQDINNIMGANWVRFLKRVWS